jgi:L-amino acid N-acyltransferase YncA
MAVPEPIADGYRIRQATMSDLAEIARIWHEGQRGAMGVDPGPLGDVHLAFFRERLTAQNETFQVWLAEDETPEVLGWQALSPMRNHPELRSRSAESSTYVSARAKGRGVGHRLIRHACAHARKCGLLQVFGFVAVNNPAMLRILDSAGWTRVGQVDPAPRLAQAAPTTFCVYQVPAESPP